MNTSLDIDAETIDDLDYAPPCESRTIFTANGVVVSERPNACENPASLIVTIHRWRDHTYISKFFCYSCLAQVSPECYSGCGAPNITAIHDLGRPRHQ